MSDVNVHRCHTLSCLVLSMALVVLTCCCVLYCVLCCVALCCVVSHSVKPARVDMRPLRELDLEGNDIESTGRLIQ
jgi:hypothetical protein